MLDDDKTKERLERHHITNEDFTPDDVVEELYSLLPDDVYTDFSKTVLDPCCGIGNLLLYVVEKRLMLCKSEDDVHAALSTIYGTELMADNVDECKERIKSAVLSSNINVNIVEIDKILNHNIVHTDMFKWNYDGWCELNPTLF